MNGKDFAIGVLSVTAAILLTGVILVTALKPEPAFAGGQNAWGGEWVMSTSQLDFNYELLYVVNVPLQRMVVYGLDAGTNRLGLLQQIDLRVGRLERQGDRGAERDRGR